MLSESLGQVLSAVALFKAKAEAWRTGETFHIGEEIHAFQVADTAVNRECSKLGYDIETPTPKSS